MTAGALSLLRSEQLLRRERRTWPSEMAQVLLAISAGSALLLSSYRNFAKVAARVPGVAGAYLNDDGDFVIALTDASQADRARTVTADAISTTGLCQLRMTSNDLLPVHRYLFVTQLRQLFV